jgi:thiol-disulfide isomerase/thioredoxin
MLHNATHGGRSVSNARRLAWLPLVTLGLLAAAGPAGDEVTLTPVKYDALLARIASNKGAKLTMVDAWATWCVPCKENFPHVVEMHKKYADKGLSVISLSLDDAEKPKKIDEARAFLKSQKAVFRNYVLDETFDDAFDKLKISAIPAVFLFGPDGKEVKRFSLEDVNKPFTYDEVEKAVKELLDAK